MDLGLAGKRVLVTGGTSGIGAATAKAFADEGARVAVNHHKEGEEADRLCRTLAGTAMPVQADIADVDAVAAMFAELDEKWGGLDILVNNAGSEGERTPAWEADPRDWEKVWRINLHGAFLCSRAALQRMIAARRGVIVNVTSVHEIVAWGGHGAYAVSKAALSMLAKTLALEAAPFGIRVLSVAPGAIRTPINEAVWRDKAALAELEERIPLARIGEPAEVAALIAVLASDVGSYVTGTTLFVDGGMTDYPAFASGG